MTQTYSAWLVAGALLLLTGCGKPEFKEHVLDGGRFKVMMPGTPTEQTQDVDGMTNKVYSLEQGSVAYAVMVAQTNADPSETEEEIQSRLDLAETEFPRAVGGTLMNLSKITLDGKHPGREMQITLPSHRTTARARAYFVGTRLYQLIVTGSKSAIESPEATKFLDSLVVLP